MSGQEAVQRGTARHMQLYYPFGVLPFNFEIQWEICLNYS